jgi:hypothetical protein
LRDSGSARITTATGSTLAEAVGVLLGLHRAVARRTVKVDAVLGFDNLKAFGEAIHLYIQRTIHLRKLGGAGLFALGTAKNFNPMVVSDHPANMSLGRPRSSRFSLP